MNMEKLKIVVAVGALFLTIMAVLDFASAQSTDATAQAVPTTIADKKREATAIRHVNEAVAVIEKMKAEPQMGNLLKQAKGLFIMPTYGRLAVGVGGSGGAGILIVRQENGTWSDPAFYNVGGLSLGVQLGMERGAIGLILRNDKAIKSFMRTNVFSLNADAGLTIEEWTKLTHASVGAGDIVAWSGAKGLFGNAVSIGINDIVFDKRRTKSYYHQEATAQDVANGKVKNTQASVLRDALKFTESEVKHSSN
jgi:lipid-binding SYLF domain-containing protein